MKWYIPGNKIFLVMKLTIALFFMATFQVGATSFAQKVTLSGRNITLPQLFETIKNQTGYDFMYDKALLDKVRPVTIQYHQRREHRKTGPIDACLTGGIAYDR
jgi:hypothetical protein